ncbi:unnamed protein product, partial [Aphanomyces euteiches]
MNNQTSLYQDIISHVVSMTWICVLLAACAVLLCVQVDGVITLNIKWNFFDILARDNNNNDNHFHRAQRAVDTDERCPTTNQEILDQELNMNHMQRIQDLERQVVEANQDKKNLEAQLQSLQHVCHQLVQGQGAPNGGIDLQQHETLPLEDRSGKTSTTDVASITDTCSNLHDDTTNSQSVEHLDGKDELKEASCPCVVPTTQDASDIEIKDVQQVEGPTAFPITDETEASTTPLEVFEPFDQDHLNERHVSCENGDTNYFQPGDPVEILRDSKWYTGVVLSVHDSKETPKSKSYSVLWWMSGNSQRRATKVLPDNLRSPVPRDMWSYFGHCIDVVFGVLRTAIEWASFPFTTTTTPYFDQTICHQHMRKSMSSNNNSTPTCVVEETFTSTRPGLACDEICTSKDEEVKCALLLIDKQTAPKTSVVHLNPPKTPNQDSDEQRALSLQTVFSFVHLFRPLKSSTRRSAVLPYEERKEVKTVKHFPREKMTMANETVVRCEQILPLVKVFECQ